MEIHELNTKTITSPAYVAFDDGTDTYKLDLNAKLSAVNTAIGQINGDITTINGEIATDKVQLNTATSDIADLNNAINDVETILDIENVQGTAISASNTVADRYITSAGKIATAGSNAFTVSWYPVESGKTYLISGHAKVGGSGQALICFDDEFDSTNQHVCDSVIETASTTDTQYNVEYTASSNGYIVMPSISTVALTVYEVSASSARLNGIEDDITALETEVSTLDSDITDLKIGNNDFETATCEVLDRTVATEVITLTGTDYTGFYLNTDKTVKSIGNTAFIVQKYAVIGGKTYNISGSQFKLAAEYPAAGFSTTGNVENNAAFDNIIFNADATAKDYNVDFVAPSDGYLLIEYYNYVSSVPLAVKASVGVMNPTKSMKIQLFGDSITDNTWGDNKTWANLIPSYIPMRDITVVNNAIGGTKLTHATTNDGVWDLVCSENNSVLDENADVIVILSGTNDWAGVTQGTGDNIGTWGGNNWTIYGALQQIIEKISTDTSAKLIICTPPQRYNSVDAERSTDSKGTPLNYNNKTLRDFCDAIIDVASYYGIMCLDLNAVLGWNRENVGKFTSDGLHPNALGDTWIGTLICNEIKRHKVAFGV